MTDIGILTCSNTTQDVGCGASGCLRAAHEGEGGFAAYPDGVRVVAIINCAGCPGLLGQAKILGRVNALVASGATAIHLSYCMLKACPYVAKYERLIAERHPGVAVVRGTHPELSDAIGAALLWRIGEELVTPGKSVPELALDLRREAGSA